MHLTNEMTHLVRQDGHKPHTMEPFQAHTGPFMSILPAAFPITRKRQLASLCCVRARQHIVERGDSSMHCLNATSRNKHSHQTGKVFLVSLFLPDQVTKEAYRN